MFVFCPDHRNAERMVATVNKALYYKDVMALLIYNITNEECMLERCDDRSSQIIWENMSQHFA